MARRLSIKNVVKKNIKMSTMIQRYTAFTLAEVLITLGIIGILAAMTIPTLLNESQEKEYKSAYKKAYSELSQAFLNAKANGDIGPLTGTFSSQGMEANFAALESQFKVIKSCSNSQTGGCWPTTGEKWRGSEDYTTPGFIDNAGMAWKLRLFDSAQATPTILLDTNGSKNPNQYGKDRFPLFLSTTNTKYPDGWQGISSTSPIGMPTRVVPAFDIVTAADLSYGNGDNNNVCPSYTKHPCYYTTWLI